MFLTGQGTLASCMRQEETRDKRVPVAAAGSGPLAGKLASEYPEWSGCQSQRRRVPISNKKGDPLGQIFWGKVCWIHLGKYKHTASPVRLIFQIFIDYWTHLGTKWAEEEKCPLIFWNVFLLLSKYFPVVGSKNPKQIKLC